MLLLSALAALADPPPVTIAFVELRHSLDFAKAELNQPVELVLAKAIESDHRVIAPTGSVIHAHISAVDKDAKHPRISLVLDDIQVGNQKVGVTGIIAAIAPKAGADLSNDAHYGMMASNEPKGIDPNRAISTEANGATSMASKLNKEGDHGFSLNADSAGAIGIDAKLDWNLATPPPATVIEAKGKKLTLEARTQMMIRMAQLYVPQ
jgi:hypothetical protein